MKVGAKIGLLVLLATIVLSGCNPFNTTDNTNSTKTTNMFNIYNNAKNTTPVITPTVSMKMKSLSEIRLYAWASGGPVHTMFDILRDFNPTNDMGTVCFPNIYYTIYILESELDNLGANLKASDTSKVVVSPFAPFTTNLLFTHRMLSNFSGGNIVGSMPKSLAYRITNSIVDCIMAFNWGPYSYNATNTCYAVSTMSFNKTTKDFKMNYVYGLDYDNTTKLMTETTRMEIVGNTDTHLFQFRYTQKDFRYSMVHYMNGKGYSKGSGNVMLIKYYESGNVKTNYYVIPSDANEDFFIGQSTNATALYTNQTMLPASVANYTNWIMTAPYFNPSELLTNTDQFGAAGKNEITW